MDEKKHANTPQRPLTRLFSVEETAGLLGISKWTVYSWTSMKKLKHVKLGRAVRFREEDLLEFIEQNTHGGGQFPPFRDPRSPAR